MKVLITGASGLVGREIVSLLLKKNYIVHYLTTSKTKITSTSNYKGFYWNPSTSEIDVNALIGVDVIVNLAGSSIAKRWTSKHKKDIYNSRIDSLNLLYNTLKVSDHQVKQIISASAIGIYPSSFDIIYDETFNGFDDSFLSNVVHDWERSVSQFENIGILTCKLRIGMVLAKKGGALPQLLKPIKIGLGSVFGTGKQIQSWIHIYDLANLFVFSIENRLNGVYNAVAPNPVSHRKMMFEIARTLEKPLYFPNTPKFILKLLLGEMHVLLFDSQKVSATKIQSTRFKFKFETISDAFIDLC